MAKHAAPADSGRGSGSNLPYAGDITPKEAWEKLAEDPTAQLVDVRTVPEWQFVGLPDLSSIGKKAVLASWQLYPDPRQNPAFIHQIRARELPKDAPLLMICRSGSRSKDAAIYLTEFGYGPCFNIAGGFEGPPDDNRHRGHVAGWKVAGLPWTQE